MKPTVKVHLWSGLRALADGQEIVSVKASNIAQMLFALGRDYPGLEDVVDEGVSVSVDGKLIADDLTHPLDGSQEIYLIQKLRGG